MDIKLLFWNDYRRVNLDLKRLQECIEEYSTPQYVPVDGKIIQSANDSYPPLSFQLNKRQKLKDAIRQSRLIRVRITRRIKRMTKRAVSNYQKVSLFNLKKRWIQIICVVQNLSTDSKNDGVEGPGTPRYNPKLVQSLQHDVSEIVECSQQFRTLLLVQKEDIDRIALCVEDSKLRIQESEDQLQSAAVYTRKRRSSTLMWNFAIGTACFAFIGACGGTPLIVATIQAASQHCVALGGAAAATCTAVYVARSQKNGRDTQTIVDKKVNQ